MSTRSSWGSRSCPLPPPTPSFHDAPPSSASSLGPRAIVGASSLANFGKGTENQDSFISSTNSSGSKAFVGVFDGHGEKGSRLSQFAKHALAKNLFNHDKLHSHPKAALDHAYSDTQHQLSMACRSDAEFSGTTAVSAYQHRDHLFVANVGDSRAVLGRCNTANSTREGAGLVAIDLTSDQKPCRADEKKRIQEQGGRVEQGMMPVQNMYGGLSFMRVGPERVMDKSGMGGLAMSRALGDLHLHPYVISQPEVSEKKLDKKDKLLILGSDGVWDHISSQEAVNIAGRHSDPQAAAREITAAAKQRWNAETQGCLSDDITAVVMRLDHPSRKEKDGKARPLEGGDPRARPSSGRSGRSHSISSSVGSLDVGSMGRRYGGHHRHPGHAPSDRSYDRGDRGSERSQSVPSVPWDKPTSLGGNGRSPSRMERMETVPEWRRSTSQPVGSQSFMASQQVPSHLLPPAGQRRRKE